MTANRTLDLEELESPEYRDILAEMDSLLAGDPVSYLHPGKRWEYPWALARASLSAGATVLDAGAGDSIFPVYLAKQGHAVTAVDLTLDGTLGERHRVEINYLAASMTALPLPSSRFDAVFCISVIEHLPESEVPRALDELRRVLRPGGSLLLTTDYYDDAEAEVWHRSPGREFRVDWRIFDEDRLRRLILDAPGWRVEGELDLDVDWEAVKPAMREYHGYPYTSVGVKLVRS